MFPGTTLSEGKVRDAVLAVAPATLVQPHLLGKEGLTGVLLQGEVQIAAYVTLLDAHISGCRECGTWTSTRSWLWDTVAQGTIPMAALVYREQSLVAVAFAQELVPQGRRTRLATCGNITGQRGFYALPGEGRQVRVQLAQAAADVILTSGVAALILCVKDTAGPALQPAGSLPSDERMEPKPRIAGTRRRCVQETFDLGTSFEASLAVLGAHTRRNLRYYRRRTERELQCQFVPALQGQPLREAVLELQRFSADPLEPGIAKNRIAQAASNAEAFCMGLHAADGRWLSWISGWRVGRETYIDWQCNRKHMERFSLSTAMRCYLIEYETLRGQTQIHFLGGTPHTMHYSFRKEHCQEWLFIRSNSVAQILRALRFPLRLTRLLFKAVKQSKAGTSRPEKAVIDWSSPKQFLKRTVALLANDPA